MEKTGFLDPTDCLFIPSIQVTTWEDNPYWTYKPRSTCAYAYNTALLYKQVLEIYTVQTKHHMG